MVLFKLLFTLLHSFHLWDFCLDKNKQFWPTIIPFCYQTSFLLPNFTFTNKFQLIQWMTNLFNKYPTYLFSYNSAFQLKLYVKSWKFSMTWTCNTLLEMFWVIITSPSSANLCHRCLRLSLVPHWARFHGFTNSSTICWRTIFNKNMNPLNIDYVN